MKKSNEMKCLEVKSRTLILRLGREDRLKREPFPGNVS